MKKLLGPIKKFFSHIKAPVLLILLSLLAGWLIRDAQAIKPKANLVWPIDNMVNVPKDLEKYLLKQDACKEYRGTGSPKGVGLWAVMQVEQSKFAKIAYGCSDSLTAYIMAVKDKSGWTLLPPVEYFANSAGLDVVPKCEVVDKYAVPAKIESFCIDVSGKFINR